MDFKAAMFDFDGTVTEKGAHSPDHEMIQALFKVSEKMPIAFCTGRQFENFEDHGLKAMIEDIVPEEQKHFMENMYLFGENGGIGYAYDKSSDHYEEFYRVDWPDQFFPRERFMAELKKEIGEFATILDIHRVAVVTRPTRLHEGMDIEEVYDVSQKIYDSIYRFLSRFDPKFEEHLHIGNSGIGVLVCPAAGDKDRGIKEFARHLNERKGAGIGAKAKEILVVGDSAQYGGNDYYLLKGEIGTPYTVGYYDPEKTFPKPVIDKTGKRLLHAEGTKFLLKELGLT